MPKILVVYYSATGNTAKLAQFIVEGIKKENIEVVLKKVQEVKCEELLGYDAIVAGSPVYYGSMAADLKKLFDDSVRFHGKLDAKIGGAFATSANIAGGNETAILDILNAMLIHGMIIQGDFRGDHYGPVAIGSPDERSKSEAIRYGQRIALLAKKMKNA